MASKCAPWPQQRVSTTRVKAIPLPEEAVRACFENATDRHEVLVRIYKLVFPGWDKIADMDGWPVVNDKTWCAICRMFFDFDKVHHPQVLPGGVWMNNGFSGEPEAYKWDGTPGPSKLADWHVSLANITIRWKEIA